MQDFEVGDIGKEGLWMWQSGYIPEICGYDLQLFHCHWNRGAPLRDTEDPNILTESIAHRKIDLNIGIYNPNFYGKPEEDYDFIISNPDSVKKNSLLIFKR